VTIVQENKYFKVIVLWVILMDAREAGIIARKYFLDSSGNAYFLFETNKVEKADGIWKVDCQIKSMLGDEKWKSYNILINDDDGAILDITKYD